MADEHPPTGSATGKPFAEGNDHRFKPGGPGGPGRPSKMAVWRERVEDEFDQWVQPYYDALNATITTTRNGEIITSDVPDHATRLRAAESVLDRVYGKPKKSIEHSGGMGLSLLDIMFENHNVGDAFKE